MTRPLAWLCLTLLAAPALAESPPASAPTQPSPAIRPVLSADLRAEYLAGKPVLIRFDVQNPSAEPTTFADLSSRPHLVRFELTGPDGKVQHRFNTPPETDDGRQWALGPRGRRQVLLQIPSSGGFKPGQWQVAITVLDDAGEVRLDPHTFILSKPRPVSASLAHDPLGSERSGHQAIWLHKAAEGYDLYLHHSQGTRPERTLGEYYLVHLDTRIEPVLTHSRPLERSGRHVYWQQDDRTIAYLQLDGQQVRGRIATIQVPWPTVSVVSRGATDPNGDLHVPLWVPAPKGSGGELRVASVRGQDGARFRSVVRLPRPPAWVESTVDASGDLRLLIAHDGFLDLYTVSALGDLPAFGQRIPVDLAPEHARFGYLPDQADAPGGLSVLGLYGSPAGMVGRWTTLGGKTVHEFSPLAPPPQGTLVDLLPRGLDPYAAVYQPVEGPAQLVMPGRPADALPDGPAGVLLTGGAGAVHLRRLPPVSGPLQTLQLADGAG